MPPIRQSSSQQDPLQSPQVQQVELTSVLFFGYHNGFLLPYAASLSSYGFIGIYDGPLN